MMLLLCVCKVPYLILSLLVTLLQILDSILDWRDDLIDSVECTIHNRFLFLLQLRQLVSCHLLLTSQLLLLPGVVVRGSHFRLKNLLLKLIQTFLNQCVLNLLLALA